MANRKYAALPDLDSAPDTYETPSLTDDNGTTQYGTTERSGSAADNYSDSDFGTATSGRSAPGSPQISRSRLQPDAARTMFEPVSDLERMRRQRRSFRATRRRLDGEYGDGKEDSDEEKETLGMKVARLRREIEEVKEMEGRMKDGETQGEEGERKGDGSELYEMIMQLEIHDRAESLARLQSSLAAPYQPRAAMPPAISEEGGQQATYTIAYPPAYNPTHSLAITSSFESRLSNLESALGLSSFSLAETPPPPVLPTLNTLAKKLAMLTSMTPVQVDALSRRVRSLTAECEKLTAAKSAARRGQTSADTTETTISADADGERPGTEDAVENEAHRRFEQEREAKINALYGTLDTIDKLAPLFPPILERLRTLRVVHAGAGKIHYEMEEALKKQEDMAKQIAGWRKGLENTEKAMYEVERVGRQNVTVTEGLVRELEERVERLEK